MLVAIGSCYFIDAHAQSSRRTSGSAAHEKTVQIDSIPQSVADFQTMQQQLATTPEGAVMMVIVAMEMYHQNVTIGEQCIKLCNVENNHYSILSRLRELFNAKDKYYGRPYQAAAFFRGATPKNGYNPTKPYTIRVRKNPTRSDERSEILRGYVKYLQVYSDGFDTYWRGCEVIQQKGSSVYKVSNCPSLYTQCKEIDFDCDREFEGL